MKAIKILFRKLIPLKYYWYEVEYSYRKKDHPNTEIFSWTGQAGLLVQNDILSHRNVRAIIKPLHLQKNIPSRLLCNGYLHSTVVCYLGRFKKQR